MRREGHLAETGWAGNHFAAHRALEVAVAGGHHILFLGEPGSGKTFLAREAQRILPPLSDQESCELRPIYERARLGAPARRPYRWPSPRLTLPNLLGSGRGRPGEVSLAHRGLLVLDDLAAFARPSLMALAHVMDEGSVTLGGGARTVQLGAAVTVLGTLGVSADLRREAKLDLAPLRRLPGSLTDRFHILMPVSGEILLTSLVQPMPEVRTRIERVRAIQETRLSGGKLNAAMSASEVARHCVLDRAGKALADAAARDLHLSPRGLRQALVVARTIADLKGGGGIQAAYLAEAFQYLIVRARWLAAA